MNGLKQLYTIDICNFYSKCIAIKSSVFLIKYHIMKTYGEIETYLHEFVMLVPDGQVHAAHAFPLKREPPVPTE